MQLGKKKKKKKPKTNLLQCTLMNETKMQCLQVPVCVLIHSTCTHPRQKLLLGFLFIHSGNRETRLGKCKAKAV